MGWLGAVAVGPVAVAIRPAVGPVAVAIRPNVGSVAVAIRPAVGSAGLAAAASRLRIAHRRSVLGLAARVPLERAVADTGRRANTLTRLRFASVPVAATVTTMPAAREVTLPGMPLRGVPMPDEHRPMLPCPATVTVPRGKANVPAGRSGVGAAPNGARARSGGP